MYLALKGMGCHLFCTPPCLVTAVHLHAQLQEQKKILMGLLLPWEKRPAGTLISFKGSCLQNRLPCYLDFQDAAIRLQQKHSLHRVILALI
ncbi:hypothetical protein BU16DRAFT_123554 [Lophium mytilinum]|uniref:Uncharacterized protein n=1 Tax=Lophium mytilinum TaxID=390894 RepID=A0A6A6QI15_9PEZI|nr:hypothetical protein BU16DRAFT_123554 [Lophium mytilinum]